MTSSAREGPEQLGLAAAGARRHWALVPCAGVGTRAGTSGPKQYALLRGQSVVAWTLAALDDVAELDAILVVLAPGDTRFDSDDMGVRTSDARPGRKPLHVARCGGATRARTVANGLQALASLGATDDDWVLVHDAARCLVRPESISRLVAACADDAVGGLLALPVPDTLKRAGAGEGDAIDLERAPVDRVDATLSRAGIWAAQTPQMFRLGLLREALHRALAHGGEGITDESSAVEALGLRPRLVRGDYENLKVTWPEDFALAQRLLRGRGEPSTDGLAACVSDTAAVHRSEAP